MMATQGILARDGFLLKNLNRSLTTVYQQFSQSHTNNDSTLIIIIIIIIITLFLQRYLQKFYIALQSNKYLTKNSNKTKSQLKAGLKRYVFDLDLKTSTDRLNLMSKGISFQCFGAATEKALFPQLFIHPEHEEDYCFLVSFFSMTDFLISKRVAPF